MEFIPKKLLLVGAAGNLLCWVGDVLLSVFPGQETVSGLTLSPAWIGAPLWRFSLSAILGAIAMMMVLCGFYALYRLLRPTVPGSAIIVICGGLLGCVPGAAFHVLCTTAAWFYDRLGGTEEAASAVMDYFTQHSPLMGLCVVGLLTACLELLRCVVRGKTCLPRWAAVYNIIVIVLALELLCPIVVIPGTMNLGGTGMFLGLWWCLQNEKGTVEYAA